MVRFDFHLKNQMRKVWLFGKYLMRSLWKTRLEIEEPNVESLQCGSKSWVNSFKKTMLHEIKKGTCQVTYAKRAQSFTRKMKRRRKWFQELEICKENELNYFCIRYSRNIENQTQKEESTRFLWYKQEWIWSRNNQNYSCLYMMNQHIYTNNSNSVHHFFTKNHLRFGSKFQSPQLVYLNL